MVSKTGEAETITSHYLFALGIYRFLYILNWIYRYYTEGFVDWISIVAGVVQTVLYCDFFYLYITKGRSERTPDLHLHSLSSLSPSFKRQEIIITSVKCPIVDENVRTFVASHDILFGCFVFFYPFIHSFFLDQLFNKESYVSV